MRSQTHTHREKETHEGGEQPPLDRPVTDLGRTLDLVWQNTDKGGSRVKNVETWSFTKGK